MLKQLLKIGLAFAIIFGANGCFKSETPKEVVKVYFDNLNKDGDYNKLAEVVTKDSYLIAASISCMDSNIDKKYKKDCSIIKKLNPDKVKISEEEYNLAKNLALKTIKFLLEDTEKIDVKIVDEKINGNEAVVAYLDEKGKKSDLYLKKVNGKWKVDVVKTIEIGIKKAFKK
jgi:hypothetical protein